jgi:hypothetical protein
MPFRGKIIDKQYIPAGRHYEEHYVRVGTIMYPQQTVTHIPERFIFILETEAGNETLNVTKKVFKKYEINDSIIINTHAMQETY